MAKKWLGESRPTENKATAAINRHFKTDDEVMVELPPYAKAEKQVRMYTPPVGLTEADIKRKFRKTFKAGNLSNGIRIR